LFIHLFPLFCVCCSCPHFVPLISSAILCSVLQSSHKDLWQFKVEFLNMYNGKCMLTNKCLKSCVLYAINIGHDELLLMSSVDLNLLPSPLW
jgi:hypothetical protein